jgi:type IV pilus assembly protein PilP
LGTATTPPGDDIDQAAAGSNSTPGVTPSPYSGAGVRDPFQPFTAPTRAEIDETRPPLERYELSELRLTAVVGAGTEIASASLEDTSGKGFIVKKGTRVGRHEGEVTEILSDRITVVEQVPDRGGRTRSNTVEFTLRKQGASKAPTPRKPQ